MVKHIFMAYFNCYILVATSWQPNHGQEVTVQNSPPMTSFLAVKNNNYKQSYYCWKSDYLKWKYSNAQKSLQGLLRVVQGLLRVLRVVWGLWRTVVEDCWELFESCWGCWELFEGCGGLLRVVQGLLRIVGSCCSILATSQVDIGQTVVVVDIGQVASWAKKRKKTWVKLQLSTKKVLWPDPTWL